MHAYLNRISTAVPPYDVHAAFLAFAGRMLEGTRQKPLFERMAARSQIEHRWSYFRPHESPSGQALDGSVDESVDAGGFFRLGDFPSTAARMQHYERYAPELAVAAANGLGLGSAAREITHVIVTSCTGLSAPGLDLLLVRHLGLVPSVERTVVGFMGCYAAMNALKLARHIVRSEPQAKVLVLSLELCTLHLQETQDLEKILSFMVFSDGAAAAIVSAEPQGLSLDGFTALLIPEAEDQITWTIRDQGFDMFLSGQVPASIGSGLRTGARTLLGGTRVSEIDLWAVHPGGKSVLDTVETALDLPPTALARSRDVLRRYGNMSSATILFVLAEMLRSAERHRQGIAMAFGPGLTAETMRFSVAG